MRADSKRTCDEFKNYHPAVNFLYFTAVIVFSMFFMHPVCLGISLICAFLYSVRLNGKAALRFNLLYMLPMLVIAAVINPTFNHEGITILTYFPNGNPLTAESVAYGIAAAVMIVTVICWFSCYNTVMTSDKFIYLFGKVIPSLSLILSMVLRFVPRFRAQLRVVSNAQKCIGRGAADGMIRRARHGITILGIMITWSLENAVETADSMRSRGYGLGGRTAFSIFKLTHRDKLSIFLLATLICICIFGNAFGAIDFRYFPSLKWGASSIISAAVYVSYFLLCSVPLIIDIAEDIKWK